MKIKLTVKLTRMDLYNLFILFSLEGGVSKKTFKKRTKGMLREAAYYDLYTHLNTRITYHLVREHGLLWSKKLEEWYELAQKTLTEWGFIKEEIWKIKVKP